MSQPTEVSEFEADVLVSTVTRPADDVVELTLSAQDGRPLPPWTPGAHIDLMLADGLVRQYSLCSSPGDLSSYRVAVLLTPDSRGGSRAVHALTEGQTLRIRGPRNNFQLVSSPRYVFIGGGIGITPMLPMIEAADTAGTDWHLYYGGRTRSSMAYADQLASYGERVTFVPQDEAGLLDIAGILASPDPDTLIYCCGPEPLLAVVEQHAAPWPHGALHLERFAAKEIEKEGDDAAFELVLQRSGLTVTVPADQTVFTAMREAGVAVLGSCLEGICGTCETGVLEGEVDHRDSVLDADEQEANDCMMVCVSRARTARLVLDA
ncbi:MAG: PDR/VanB family oxidoreductase [Nocardioidaceae bacterium]